MRGTALGQCLVDLVVTMCMCLCIYKLAAWFSASVVLKREKAWYALCWRAKPSSK